MKYRQHSKSATSKPVENACKSLSEPKLRMTARQQDFKCPGGRLDWGTNVRTKTGGRRKQVAPPAHLVGLWKVLGGGTWKGAFRRCVNLDAQKRDRAAYGREASTKEATGRGRDCPRWPAQGGTDDQVALWEYFPENPFVLPKRQNWYHGHQKDTQVLVYQSLPWESILRQSHPQAYPVSLYLL